VSALFIILLVTAAAPSAFEYRESAPAALFPFVRAVSDTGTGSIPDGPAGLALYDMYYVSAAYARPYSLQGLNAASSRTGYSDGVNGVQAAYSFFGTDEYGERSISLKAGRLLHPRLAAGLGLSRHDLTIEADGYSMRRSFIDCTAAVLVMPFDWLRAGFIHENIRSSFDKSDGTITPAWSAGLSVAPARGISLEWNLTREYYGSINSLAISANLIPRLGIRAGYARETSSFAGAVVFSLGHLILSYGIRQHAYLGSTHTVALTALSSPALFDGIRYETLRRKRGRVAPVRRVDINSCGIDDLNEIPVLREGIPERIIKYREMIGPVSRHALRQIGMEEREILELMDYAEGLAEDPGRAERERRNETRRRGAPPTRPFASQEKRKELFSRLLARGVPASLAIRIADRARELGRDELIREISGMKDISEHLRKTIIAACSE
jgi:hypothetical protein